MPALSLAVIVRLSEAPALGVVEATVRTKWSAGPAVTFASTAALVADQERYLAMTL